MRVVLIAACVALAIGCDRGRAVNEVGAQGTRAAHARDDVERVADRSRWSADAGVDAALPALEMVPGTPLAFGEIEVVSQTENARLERQPWAFDGIRGQAWRVRIARPAASLRVLPSTSLETIGTLVGEPAPGDFVAINGGFYDVDKSAMGLVVSGAKELQPLRKNGGSGIVESRDGVISVVHRKDWKPGADEALQSIDRIIADDESLMTEGRRERHAARSAIGVSPEFIWVVVAFEDQSISPGDSDWVQLRSTSFRGLPLWGFARYLRETTDATDVLNLDGAVSTQLVAQIGGHDVDIRGELGTINGIVVTGQ